MLELGTTGVAIVTWDCASLIVKDNKIYVFKLNYIEINEERVLFIMMM